MIIEICTIHVHQGKAGAFQEAFARAQRYLQSCPHCLNYQLTRCTEEDERFVLRIEWDSLDGHMVAFRGSPDYQEFRGLLNPFYRQSPEVLHYEPVELGVPSKS